MMNSAMLSVPPSIGGPPFPGYGFGPMMMPPPMIYPQPALVPIVQVEQKVEEKKIDFHAKWNSNIEHSTNCPFCQKKFFFKERVLLEKLKIEQASKKIENQWNSNTYQEPKYQNNYNSSYNNTNINGQIYGNSYGNSFGNENGQKFNFVQEKYAKSEVIEDDDNQNQLGYTYPPVKSYNPGDNIIEIQGGVAQKVVDGDYNENQSYSSVGENNIESLIDKVKALSNRIQVNL